MLIEKYELDLSCPPCAPGSESWIATVKIDKDLSEIMPYVNATVKNAFYDPKIPTIVWKEGVHKFFLRKNEFGINNLHDRAHAERRIKKLVEMLNDIWERRDEIQPNYESRKPLQVLEVFKLLPKTNCGECAYSTCMAFATALSQGEASIDNCPLIEDEKYKDNLEKLRELGL